MLLQVWGGFLSFELHPRHQHCTDEAQMAEIVLAAVCSIFLYIDIHWCIVGRINLVPSGPFCHALEIAIPALLTKTIAAYRNEIEVEFD